MIEAAVITAIATIIAALIGGYFTFISNKDPQTPTPTAVITAIATIIVVLIGGYFTFIFYISNKTPTPTPTNITSSTLTSSPSVRIINPSSNGNITVNLSGSTYHFPVTGTATGVTKDMTVFLWVKPVNPPGDADVWYLQHDPINHMNNQNGSLRGTGGIGNPQYPPHNGDTMNILITVVRNDYAHEIDVQDQPVAKTEQDIKANAVTFAEADDITINLQ
jgi:hypothetical protein